MEESEMKIMERDIEVMGWILEQKFMTEQQVRRILEGYYGGESGGI